MMSMRKRIVLFVFFVVLGFSSFANSFEHTTALGIRIRATQATINQYNTHWQTFEDLVFPNRPNIGQYVSDIGPKWDTIDWSVIDQFYSLLQAKHGYPIKADPTKLIISIRSLAYGCWRDHGDGYDFASSYGCIDGLYASNNKIVIHLGDDPGQMWKYSISRPFCSTALVHELNHYFLFWKNDPDWYGEAGGFIADYQNAYEICK